MTTLINVSNPCQLDNGSLNQSTYQIDELIKKLRIIFDSDQVDVDELEKILRDFHCDFSEWQRFTFFSKTGYTRNLVDEGNGKYNLLLLCWSGGQKTGIHDHAGSHCFVKAIKGQVKETIFNWPKDFSLEKLNDFNNHSDIPLTVKSTLVMNPGDVTYMHDKIGIHRLQNASDTEPAITLHLYCPPYQESINFEETTCKAKKCELTFYSKFGRQIE
ncbi:unnamed protein product [Trichobilharzia szidati]|nr:unnamed protein product [Trichobilharzia szidati]